MDKRFLTQSECLDYSDLFICPASACLSDTRNYFPCHDGKYCILRGLVCDGYAQCEDESGKKISSTSYLAASIYVLIALFNHQFAIYSIPSHA